MKQCYLRIKADITLKFPYSNTLHVVVIIVVVVGGGGGGGAVLSP
jgi:hypothetical protein